MVMLWSVKNLLHKESSIVCYDHLLEETPQHLTAAIDSLGIVEVSLLLELRKKIGGSLNRACHQLWEETDESEERQNVASGLNLLSININGIAQSLECIETDAHWKHKIQNRPIGCNAETIHHFLKTVGKEVIVLKSPKDAKIQYDVTDSNGFSYPSDFADINPNTAAKTAKGGKGNQKQEFIVPPTIENVAYNDHQ